MATDLTFAVAVSAGLLSFASPCVLPLVPAYLGQLTAVAVASQANGVPASNPAATLPTNVSNTAPNTGQTAPPNANGSIVNPNPKKNSAPKKSRNGTIK